MFRTRQLLGLGEDRVRTITRSRKLMYKCDMSTQVQFGWRRGNRDVSGSSGELSLFFSLSFLYHLHLSSSLNENLIFHVLWENFKLYSSYILDVRGLNYSTIIYQILKAGSCVDKRFHRTFITSMPTEIYCIQYCKLESWWFSSTRAIPHLTWNSPRCKSTCTLCASMNY